MRAGRNSRFCCVRIGNLALVLYFLSGFEQYTGKTKCVFDSFSEEEQEEGEEGEEAEEVYSDVPVALGG